MREENNEQTVRKRNYLCAVRLAAEERRTPCSSDISEHHIQI